MIGTAELAAYYRRSEQTVRTWSREFEAYLSPTANPGERKGRSFTIEDMKVIALIADGKDRNETFEQIHAALKAGQRGDPPNFSETDLKVLKATEGEKRAAFEIHGLNQHISDLQTRLDRAEKAAQEAQQLKIQSASQETEIRLLKEQMETTKTELSEELTNAQEAIRLLEREVGTTHGQAYIEGYKAGQREQGRGEEAE